MSDDEVGAGEMIDSRWAFGIVHSVGHVSNQCHVLSKFDHLTNAEGTAKDAHVEVDATEDDVLNVVGSE